MAEDKIERIYTVPLGASYDYVRNKRASRAVDILRSFLVRHMKAEDRKVVISNALNSFIWKDSIQKPPRKVKIRAVRDAETVHAYLHDEKMEKPKADKKAEKKTEAKDSKKAEVPKTESKPVEKPKEEPKAEEAKPAEKKPEPSKPAEAAKEAKAPEKADSSKSEKAEVKAASSEKKEDKK